MAEVQVENIVVSFSVADCLDLQKIAAVIPDAQYTPDEVPAVVLQFPKPRSMAAVSSTGAIVVTGPKSMDEVHVVMKMVTDRLNLAGIESQDISDMTVQNVTVSTDLHQKVKLRSLARNLENAEYTPRVFPGLIYKGDDPNTVILLFDSGKIVCNSGTLDDATVALEKMVEKLLSFGIKKEEDVCLK
jgi:transcription initiation factor TFIID TATA-box-binding protein